jgi:hypothetical protein
MIASLVAIVALSLPAEDGLNDSELAQKAEQEFSEGLRRRQAQEKSRARFRSAVACYEELIRRGASNAGVYRSLGNARFLAGDQAGAFHAYRQGLRIAPGSRLLRECLDEARERVAFTQGSKLGRAPEDLRPPWVAGLRPTWMFALCVLAWVLGCAAFTRWLMLRRRWMLLAALLLLAGAALGTILIRSQQGQEERPLVVIAADGVLLRKGDGELFPARYDTPLNRGVEAELLFRRDGWLQIELSGGEVGWVAESQVVGEIDSGGSNHD